MFVEVEFDIGELEHVWRHRHQLHVDVLEVRVHLSKLAIGLVFELLSQLFDCVALDHVVKQHVKHLVFCEVVVRVRVFMTQNVVVVGLYLLHAFTRHVVLVVVPSDDGIRFIMTYEVQQLLSLHF